MVQRLLKFFLLLFICAGGSYILHIYFHTWLFPEKPFDLIKFAYKFNIGITFLFTSTIIMASERLKDQLGFIFMAGSFIKLVIFMFLIKTAGFSTEKSSFLNFFIPYVVCVAIEIFYVVKILNGINFNKDK